MNSDKYMRNSQSLSALFSLSRTTPAYVTSGITSTSARSSGTAPVLSYSMAHLPGSEHWPHGHFYFLAAALPAAYTIPNLTSWWQIVTACALHSGKIFICTAWFGITFLDFVIPSWISYFLIAVWHFFLFSFLSFYLYLMSFPSHLLQHLGSLGTPQQLTCYR